MIVTLSIGVDVQLQRVDLSGLMPSTLAEALNAPIVRIGMENAKEGSEMLASILDAPSRPEEQWPDELQNRLALASQADARLLMRGCVAPTLPELLALYGGDLEDADLGMGPDFITLRDALQALNGSYTSDDLAEARLFLKEWGTGLDSMGKRYGKRPSELIGFPPEALERERLALDLGVYYWARGEDGKDEWWRKSREEIGPKRVNN